MCRRPSRRSVVQTVVSEPTTTPCSASAARSSASVIPGLAAVSCRSRRISVIAAEGLTSNRRAAARAELPASTARTKRSRKAADSGAVITTLLASPQAPIWRAEHVKPESALGVEL